MKCQFLQADIALKLRQLRAAGVGYQIRLDDLQGDQFNFYSTAEHRMPGNDTGRQLMAEFVARVEQKGQLGKPEQIQWASAFKKFLTNKF